MGLKRCRPYRGSMPLNESEDPREHHRLRAAPHAELVVAASRRGCIPSSSEKRPTPDRSSSTPPSPSATARLLHRPIWTRSILERIDAGESIEAVATNYEVSVEAVEDAVLFELAA